MTALIYFETEMGSTLSIILSIEDNFDFMEVWFRPFKSH